MSNGNFRGATNSEPSGLWSLSDVYENRIPFKPVSATGGTITTITVNGKLHKVHSFTSGSSSFSVDYPGFPSEEIEYLVVGGGGGGGNGCCRAAGGGGGAGGFLEGSIKSRVGSFSVTVGNGGAGNTSGQDSFFGEVTAVGGGGGTGLGKGKDGGSGAGSTYSNVGVGLGTAGQGNNGAPGSGTGASNGGGGGGAGSSGSGRTGGAGKTSSIRTGSNVTYATGGTGGAAFGQGGGSAGANNTGNGGGGVQGEPRFESRIGAPGGRGIVVLRYKIEA